MIITYQYRVKPSLEQQSKMDWWCELLRRHYNYALGQRLDWLRRTRCLADRCSVGYEPIGEIPGKAPNYNFQAGELKQTKALFPDYQNIYHDVQQQNLKRLDKAWQRWVKPDKSRRFCGGVSGGEASPPEPPWGSFPRRHSAGKRGGRPRFKKLGELRSFVFPRINCPKAGATLKDRLLKLSGIGEMLVVMHRHASLGEAKPHPQLAPLPEGFTPKTCTVVRQADGWYVSISLEDASVPSSIPLDTVKLAVGIDVGLKAFMTTSDGESVPVQQVYRQAQAHLARQQRKLARKQKGSEGYLRQQNCVAKVHQRIRRQRQYFHYRTAHDLVKKYDLIVVEDLNIKGLTRTNLAKSILDVAWGKFLTILEAVAVRCGIQFVKVNPYGTSQDCSGCGVKVLKDLSIRIHECPRCGLELDRDVNAAVNILERGLKAVGLIVSACGSLGNTQLMKQEVLGATLRSPSGVDGGSFPRQTRVHYTACG